MNFKKHILVLFLLSVLPLSSCGRNDQQASTPGTSAIKDKQQTDILLRIGTHDFSKDQFFGFRKRAFEAMGIDSALGAAENTAILSRWIEDRLLISAAEDEGITVSKSEADRLRKELSAFVPDFKQIPQEELLKQKYLEKMVKDKIVVTQRDMKNYYREHSSEFMASKVYHVKEILLSDEMLARQIRNELLSGGKSRFGAFAKQFSIAPSAASGGDLGYFKRGELPPEFEKIIRKLKPGSFSKVIKTKYGYHIFYLEEVIRAHAQKFYEVKDRIRDNLRRGRERKALDDLLKKLYARYSPVLYTDQLDFDLSKGIISGEIRLEEKNGI